MVRPAHISIINLHNSQEEENMEMRYYLRIIQRGWWIILLTILVAVNASLIVSYLTVPQFQTVSRFVVSPNATLFTDSWDVVSSLDTLDRRSIINTYKEVLASPTIYADHETIASISPEELDEYTTLVTVVPDTNIVQMTVSGPDANRVVAISKAISSSSIGYINDLYPVYSFDIMTQPEVPTEPFQPKPLQNALLALIAGLIIGLGLAFLRDQLQNTIESMRQRTIVDGVSTAYTRDYFEKRLLGEISMNPGKTTSLGIINFRGLEEVMDVLPQGLTNQTIQNLTQIVREELRGRDLVGRWGRSQLAVMLPSTPLSAAEQTFRRLQRMLGDEIRFEDSSDLVIHPDPCIGIGATSKEDSLEELLEETEDAVEKASAIVGDTLVSVELGY